MCYYTHQNCSSYPVQRRRKFSKEKIFNNPTLSGYPKAVGVLPPFEVVKLMVFYFFVTLNTSFLLFIYFIFHICLVYSGQGEFWFNLNCLNVVNQVQTSHEIIIIPRNNSNTTIWASNSPKLQEQFLKELTKGGLKAMSMHMEFFTIINIAK